MTGAEFSLYVKAKLNRLDTSSWEDVRTEEILFFGRDALKRLSLRYDAGTVPVHLQGSIMNMYLSSITETIVLNLTGGVALLTSILKIKDTKVQVKIGNELRYVPTRELATQDLSFVTNSPLSKSFPDKPIYHLSQDRINFVGDGFTCEKVEITFIKSPAEILENSVLTIPFTMELQDETVKLILENLESRRIQTQPAIVN
jgi:hypothetical protein